MICPSIDYITKKAQSINRAEGIAHTAQELLHPAFLPYVGKKIRNADGTLIKPLRDRVSEIQKFVRERQPDAMSISFNCWIESSDYLVFFYVRLDLKGAKYEHSREAIKTNRCICTIARGCLDDLKPVCKRDLYTAEEIHESLVKLESLRAEVEEIESKISQFI